MPPDAKQVRPLKVLLHAAYFLSGISTVLIGQVLPILSLRLELNDRQAGYFFVAQILFGSVLGTVLSNSFGRRNRFLLATLIGSAAMAVGALMLNFAGYELCLAAFFINGVGVGLTLPSINMLTLELNPLRGAAALSVLNFFWGLGAIISQPFVDFFSSGTSLLLPTAIHASALALVTLALAFVPREIEQKPVFTEENRETFSVPIWTNPIAWMIALFNFIHVGFESGMGGWLKTYTQRLEETAAASLLPPITLYFIFFVAGRGTAPVFLRFLDENRMLLASLLVILLGMVILLVATDVATLSIGAAIAGFGTSSVFPTNMSRFTKTFGASASRRATPFFICGTLGAASTNWIIGFVSNYFNNDLRSGMFILLGSVVILILLQTVLILNKTGNVRKASG